MKTCLVVLCVLGVAYAEVSLQAVFQAKWRNFKAQHGKEYTRAEEPHRLNAFLSNSLAIESHNERFARGLESFKLAHNHMSDMTMDEYKEKMLGLRKPGLEASLRHNCSLHEANKFRAAPSSMTWVPYLPPVKNQGSCGSCYAFAATCPVEGIYGKKTGTAMPLSEQEIVDCDKVDNGCSGGFYTNVWSHMIKSNGVSSESAYKYAGSVNQCAPKGIKYGKITSFKQVANNEQAMKDALCNAPVAIAVKAALKSFQFYSGGVYSDTNVKKGDIDHAVTAVGYAMVNGQLVFNIRNSWGEGWGEKGYMRCSAKVPNVMDFSYFPVCA